MTVQLAAEIAAGEGLGLAEAARRLPPARAGRPCHPATLTRWIKKGVRTRDGRRVHLEAAHVGGRLVTSAAALQRFVLAQSSASTSNSPAPKAPTDRQAAIERELAELGV